MNKKSIKLVFLALLFFHFEVFGDEWVNEARKLRSLKNLSEQKKVQLYSIDLKIADKLENHFNKKKKYKKKLKKYIEENTPINKDTLIDFLEENKNLGKDDSLVNYVKQFKNTIVLKSYLVPVDGEYEDGRLTFQVLDSYEKLKTSKYLEARKIVFKNEFKKIYACPYDIPNQWKDYTESDCRSYAENIKSYFEKYPEPELEKEKQKILKKVINDISTYKTSSEFKLAQKRSIALFKDKLKEKSENGTPISELIVIAKTILKSNNLKNYEVMNQEELPRPNPHNIRNILEVGKGFIAFTAQKISGGSPVGSLLVFAKKIDKAWKVVYKFENPESNLPGIIYRPKERNKIFLISCFSNNNPYLISKIKGKWISKEVSPYEAFKKGSKKL